MKRHRMIRSIRVKFTLWYIGSLLLLFLLASGVSEWFFHQDTLRLLDQRLSESVGRVERELASCAQPEQAEAFQICFDAMLRTLFPFDFVFAQLLEFSNTGLSSSTILARSSSLQNTAFSLSGKTYQDVTHNTQFFETARLEPSNLRIRVLTQKIQPSTGPTSILQFATVIDAKEVPSQINRDTTPRGHVFSVTFFILLLLTPVFGYFFMKRAFAPIHTLVTLARNISAEDLSHRIEGVNSRDEIGELADTFNEMIARLDSSFQHIRQFSGDVAHELKTPLTALKGELDVALRKERSPEEYRDILSSVLEDTENLDHIIEDLLFLSRLDAQSLSISFNRVSLDDIVLEMYESTLNMAQKRQISLALRSLDSADITGDAGLIKRLLTNLIVNAIHYTPEGGTVELSVEATEEAVRVTVRDTGIGIPEDVLPHIFDRFYRVDPSRAHETGGSGLGLAIAQKIADVHQARIDVDSQIGAGTTFTVSWMR